jgi:succinate dehydrogenase / fumarate reductase, cytochrome b subunit
MSTAATSQARSGDAAFLRTRLGSLLAVLPLSVWTVVHLWENLAVFKGAAAWQHSVTEYGHPLAFFVASLVALLPLGIHTVWGIGRLFTAQPNNVRYKFFQNTKYALQRLSAIGVLFFLGAHIWLAFLEPRIYRGRPEQFAEIAREMHHHGPTLLVYVLGVLGVAYHLANGLYGFAMGWGVVTSRRALRRLEGGVVVTFLVLLAMGWASVYGLWDAGR